MNMLLLVLLNAMVEMVSCSNILVILPLPIYSHTNTFLPVFRELNSRGHNITMVSPYPQTDNRPDNWTDIVIDKRPMTAYLGTVVETLTEANVYTFYPAFWRLCTGIEEIALKDENMQELIRREDLKFDLFVTEVYYAHEVLATFSHKLNVPIVGLNPYGLSSFSSYLTGNQIFRADAPNYRSQFTNRMTFVQRFLNTVIDLLELSTAYLYYLPMQEELARKYMVYPGSDSRQPLEELLKNVTILLTDSHPSIGYPRPIGPNIIEVGGLSIKSSTQLPQDLQTYMDDSTNGFIYLNFGTFLRVSSLGEGPLKVMVSVFRRLRVNVIMKWEKGRDENWPPNVLARDWFPQPAVLAHVKCRLFISHGGLHGISEAAHHGVPVLGIPFFGDQLYNLRFAEEAGYGYLIPGPIAEISEHQLYQAITDVLNNKTYKENAMRLSRITRDRPMSALDTAVYWIEYVLRHKDVRHLIPSGRGLPLYQQLLVDVVLVILIIISIVLLSIYITIRKLIRFVRNGNKDKCKQE